MVGITLFYDSDNTELGMVSSPVKLLGRKHYQVVIAVIDIYKAGRTKSGAPCFHQDKIYDLFLHKSSHFNCAVGSQADHVGSDGEIADVDFNPIRTIFLPINQGTSDGVDLNQINGF